MFTSKRTEKVGRGKTAGQEFIDEIFFWKIQLSKPEAFPFPRMKHHSKKCNKSRILRFMSELPLRKKAQNSEWLYAASQERFLRSRRLWFIACLLSLRIVLGCYLFKGTVVPVCSQGDYCLSAPVSPSTWQQRLWFHTFQMATLATRLGCSTPKKFLP